MRLNDKYLAVRYETNKLMKKFYLEEHLSQRWKDAAPTPEWWETRQRIAIALTRSPKNLKMYYITKTAQEEAELVEYDKINLHWFSQVPNGDYTYVVDVNDFYRFQKTDERLNVLNYFHRMYNGELHLWYDSYSIILERGELAMLPSQDQSRAQKFVKLLLYIELGEVTMERVEVQKKVKYGSKGDESLYNDTNFRNVFVVNSNWNKIIVVEGGFRVRGHFRVQGTGPGRSIYKLVWVREYEKSGYIRTGGHKL